MVLNKEEILTLYRKEAKNHDVSANLYYLLGFREHAYRKKAVTALNLHPGDTVVEIGCGTGLNFTLLQRNTSSTGKIIDLDLTDHMLDQARERVAREGWSNVDLIHMDAAKYQFPQNVNGILSTFAITFVPEYDRIIQNGAQALTPGGRFVILDLKLPENLPFWLIQLGVWLTSPFGVTLEAGRQHPWESIEKYLTETSFSQFYLAFTFIWVGEAPKKRFPLIIAKK